MLYGPLTTSVALCETVLFVYLPDGDLAMLGQLNSIQYRDMTRNNAYLPVP